MVVTGIYASLLACLMLGLAYNVVRNRLKFRIGLLDGENETLKRAIRVHGNATEYLPLTLILFAIAETNGLMFWGLHILGITLVVARAWHAYGLYHSSTLSKGRYFGTLITWIVILLLAGYNLWHGIGYVLQRVVS